MNQQFTAVVKQDGPWWISWVEEVPGVNCQERTRDELPKTLRVTLMEALEMNRTDAREAAAREHSGSETNCFQRQTYAVMWPDRRITTCAYKAWIPNSSDSELNMEKRFSLISSDLEAYAHQTT